MNQEQQHQERIVSPFRSEEAIKNLEGFLSDGQDSLRPSSSPQEPALDFSRLVMDQPQCVLQILQSDAIIKLGDFFAKDYEVIPAFGDRMMLTRGQDDRAAINFKAFWKSELAKSARAKKQLQLGWSKDIELSAYVLNVKGATASNSSGLLHKILLNLKAGVCDVQVFAFPAIRAIVDYKWNSWIKNLLIVELVLYICWMLTYWIFLISFLSSEKMAVSMSSGDWMSSSASISILLAFIFMWPFIIIEFCTIKAYRSQWFSLWNLIDMGSYILQVLIFVVYFAGKNAVMAEDWFSVCLAVESVLLFFRLQFFARAFGSIDVSFVDTLQVVLKEVRWFFLFIFLAVVSFSLAFGALFRGLDPEENLNRTGDFSEVWKAMVSTFGFMMGGFDVDYFFAADETPAVVGSVLFVVYQTLINITLLNLLVAIIIEAYSKIKSREELTMDYNRAQVIDEMEMIIPSWLQGAPKQFIHLLVIKTGRGEFFPESISLPDAIYQQESLNVPMPPERVTFFRKQCSSTTENSQNIGRRRSSVQHNSLPSPIDEADKTMW